MATTPASPSASPALPPASPSASPALPATSPPAIAPSPVSELAKAELPPVSMVEWEAKGRRDPFEPLNVREGAAGTTVAAARLTGIVRGKGATLALIETSDGLGYIMKQGDTLGDGRLLEIGPNAVVFSVTPRPGTTNNRVVLRLAGD